MTAHPNDNEGHETMGNDLPDQTPRDTHLSDQALADLKQAVEKQEAAEARKNEGKE